MGWQTRRRAIAHALRGNRRTARPRRSAARLAASSLPRDYALVQPLHGIERRENGSLLPGRQIGGVLASEHDASVDCTEILVVIVECLVGPQAEAAQRPWNAMPRNRDTVVEFVGILRMDLGAPCNRLLHPFRRRQRRELERIGTERISAEQHALSGVVIAAGWIADLPDRQVGVGDPAVD